MESDTVFLIKMIIVLGLLILFIDVMPSLKEPEQRNMDNKYIKFENGKCSAVFECLE